MINKLVKIEFEPINTQQIKICGYDEDGNKKEIGLIFTPSSSAMNNLNCIQICGFKEAFDLWGCSRYNLPVTEDVKLRVCDSLEGKPIKHIQAKDIQLMFSFDTDTKDDYLYVDNCERCFNRPCTCENKKDNPYTIKRESQLPIIRKNYLSGKPEEVNHKLEEELYKRFVEKK